MLKRLIQVSSLTGLLAIAAILPAAAAGWSGASEEDAAAPTGSFTSAMAIPARAGHHHFFHFDRHHAQMERRMHRRFG